MCVFSWRRAGGVGGTWGIRVSFAGNVKEAHQRLRSSAAATRVVVCVYDGSLARRWRGARRPRRAAHRHWTCVSTAAGVCVLVCCCEGVRIGVGVLGVPAVARGAARHRARARTSRLRMEGRLIAFATRTVAVFARFSRYNAPSVTSRNDESRGRGVKGVWTLNVQRCLKDELGGISRFALVGKCCLIRSHLQEGPCIPSRRR